MDSKQPGPAMTRGPTVRVGRYELTSELFRSEVDALWSGRATGGENETPVLVRRIMKKAPVSDETFQAITEAAFAVVDVRHARITAVADVVVTANEVAIVSEHSPGRIFLRMQQTAKLKQLPLPIPAALRLAVDLLDGLVASNALLVEAELPENMLHGGMTPDFAWVTAEGEALLLDLSVALAIAADPKLVRLPHSLAYRSPEQLSGRADARSDVYAVGVMLWEILANRSHIPSASRPKPLARLDSVTRSDRAAISKPIADLVARATDVEPENRFASPQEMADAIQALGAELVADMAGVKAAVERLSQPAPAMKSTGGTGTTPKAPEKISDSPLKARLPPPKAVPKPAAPVTTEPSQPEPTDEDEPITGRPPPKEEAPPSSIKALFDDLVLPTETAATEVPTIAEVPRFDSGPVAELLSSPSLKSLNVRTRPVEEPSWWRRRIALVVAGIAVAAVALITVVIMFLAPTRGAKTGQGQAASKSSPFSRLNLFRGAPADAGSSAGDASPDAHPSGAAEQPPPSVPLPHAAPLAQPDAGDKPLPKKKVFMPTAI